MEEDHYSPSEVNSVDVKDTLHVGIVCVNKKRKLQAEQLGMRLPKHKSWDHRGLGLEVGSPLNAIPEKEDFCMVLLKQKPHGDEEVGESELDSGNGSNSFAEDTDSYMSICGEPKNELQLQKTFSVDGPSSSVSVNWANDSYKGSQYSLDSRSVTHKNKSPFKDVENNSSHHDMLSSLNYEQLLEYESNLHYGYEGDSIEQCTDKDRQDLLYASSGNPNNFVLSSGRWDVNSQETQPVTEKLTIDKEFEQYFSTLML